MTINERFSEIINKLYGGNKRAFAAAIKVNPSVVGNLTGKRQGNPSYEVLEKTCRYTKVNAAWLVTGEGKMLQGLQLMTPEEMDEQDREVASEKVEEYTYKERQLPAGACEECSFKDLRIASMAEYIESQNERIAELKKMVEVQQQFIDMLRNK